MALITVANLHDGSPVRYWRAIYRKINNFVWGSVCNGLRLGCRGEKSLGTPCFDTDCIGAGRGRRDNVREGVHAVAAAIASRFGGAFGNITGRGYPASKTRVSVVGGGSGHGERDGAQGGQGYPASAIVVNCKRHHRRASCAAISAPS